jgi:hypothetical protein
MPYVLPIGKFHEIYNRMGTYLLAYRDYLVDTAVTQAEKEWEHFTIGKDYLRGLQSDDFPAVILYPPNIIPVPGRSANDKYMHYRADYVVDLIAGEQATNQRPSDQNTVERLLYLMQQVMSAYYQLKNVTFETVGQIGSKTYPTFTTYIPSEEKGHITVVASQMAFSVEMFFAPQEFNQDIENYVHKTPVPLTGISITDRLIKNDIVLIEPDPEPDPEPEPEEP